MRRQAIRGGCLLAVWLGSAVCGQKPDPALRVVAQFAEAYYVKVDHRRALGFTAGQARALLEAEIGLVGDTTVVPTGARPKLSLDLRKRRDLGEDIVAFLYRFEIEPTRAAPFTRDVLITASRVDDRWLVTEFLALNP